MSPLALAQEIEHSRIGLAIRHSTWAFSVLILIHLSGLMVAAGTVVFWDLRLLGLTLAGSPVSHLRKRLLPWTWSGFAVMAMSGLLLAWCEAGRLYENFFFRAKLLLLLLAGLNVLTFHLAVYPGIAGWDSLTTTPVRARIAGGLSLLLWFGIIAAGRAIGYSLDYGV